MRKRAVSQASGWAKPAPFGAPAAVQSLSGTAAPLLAGFCLTVLTLVLQGPDRFRYPGAMLLLLTSAIVLLLTCVQCGFWARQYYAAPDEAASWFPDFESSAERRDRVQQEQRSYYASYLFWANLARLTYAMGIVAVYSALAASLVPKSDSADSRLRTVAALVFAVAAVAEVVWTGYAWRRSLARLVRRRRR
jgi:hypothetical protein